ncbi:MULTISPECIES: ATP-binding protein [Streptomyces]|nr:ATP-binding protein [Streptomyces sp. NBC_01373]MCX4705823.1 ATP-binding protein [Streptomyces sp. NBC_01373]
MTSHQGDAVSSPANHVLREPGRAAPGAGGADMTGPPPRPRPVDLGEHPALRPTPLGEATDSAALRIRCSGEGFALARTFTRDTLRCWSLDHHSDDAVLVITELAANAVAHAVPRAPAGETEVWLGLLLDPAHVVLSVSDPGDNVPEFTGADATDLREHGRGLCIVDALAEEWGWTLKPPAGKTVWARLSTCPPP